MSYLSWSQLYLYRKDPNEYYIQYVMGVKQPPTMEMKLGSIVHKAIEHNWDYTTLVGELKRNNFTSDYHRTTENILSKAPRYPLQEQRILIEPSPANGLKVAVLAILDGFDDVRKKLGEYKTTSSGWSQQQVDEHDQITLYDLVCYLKYGWIPLNELHSMNVKNGKIHSFFTTRSEERIMNLRDEINGTYESLVERGWWNRKINSYVKT